MRLEVFADKKKTFLLAFTSLLLLACMYFLITDQRIQMQILGWLGICTFTVGFFNLLKQLFSSGPLIVIDHQGINDKRTRMGVISWDDILSISVGEIRGVKLISIRSSNPQKYLNKVSFFTSFASSFNKSLGFSEITISPTCLTHSTDQILLFIKKTGFLR